MKTHYKTAMAVVTTFFIFSSANLRAQKQAAIEGIDHIGINVPDLPQALHFFQDVLGFTPVTQIGPIALDSAWKKQNHMQLGTGPVTIKMIHARTGASIEVFWYATNKGNKKQPGGDDLSATHIAFYTSDINSAVTYLKSKGVKLLGEPFTTPVGDTKGETWVYFLAPWGAKMELVSYPDGKEYEKNNPKQILWSPRNKHEKNVNNIKNSNMDTTANRILVEDHINIWNEQDETKRNTLMQAAYAENIDMVDRHFIATGYTQINGFVNGLQQKNPGARFTHVKPIDTHHNIARLYWQFGTKEQPALVTGMDMFVIENGKVEKLYVFVDGQE